MQASDFSPLVGACCAEVLDAMYFTTVLETVHHSVREQIQGEENLTYTLRFEGDICGSFGLKVPLLMGRTLASNFLGEDEEALSHSEISEVVGELANMLCGSIVSRIDSIHKFILSHPEPFLSLAVPSAPLEDILISILTTDSGDLQTWIIVDPPPHPELHTSGRLASTSARPNP